MTATTGARSIVLIPVEGRGQVAIRTAYIDSGAGPPNGATNPAADNIRQPLFHGDFSQYIID
jgi:hypothetical protein